MEMISASIISIPSTGYSQTFVPRTIPSRTAPPLDRSSAGSSSDHAVTLGLAGPTYYNGFNPFLNWWKTANVMAISRTAGGELAGKAVWDAGVYLSPATGEIVNPAPPDLVSIFAVFFSPPNDYQVSSGCDYSNEPWVVEWDGSATGRIDYLTAGGTQSAVGSNKIVFKMGVRPDNTQLTLILRNRNDPPRNVRIYQQRYATNVAAGEKFNPDWLAVIKKCGGR